MTKLNECRYCLYFLDSQTDICPKCGSLLINQPVKKLHEGQVVYGIAALFIAVILFSEVAGLSLFLFLVGGLLITGMVNLNG